MFRQHVHICTDPTIGPIPEGDRHPDRVALFLQCLGYFSAFDNQLDEIAKFSRLIELAKPAKGVYGSNVWHLGKVRVSNRYQPQGGQLSLFHLQCNTCFYSSCVHTRALLFAFAWRDPAWRSIFEAPLWEMALRNVLPTQSEDSGGGERPRKQKKAHDGYIRYNLEPPEANAGAIKVTPKLVRLSVRDGSPLKPIKCPKTWEGVTSKIRGWAPHDEEIFEIREQIAQLESIASMVPAGRTRSLTGFVRSLWERLAGLLSMCDDVRYEGEPIAVEPAYLEPTVTLREEGADAFAMEIEPELLALWTTGMPFALTADRVLRRVDKDHLELLKVHANRGLPHVPSQDLGRFLERFEVLNVPIDVPDAGTDVNIHPSASREGRLFLYESGRSLVVDARFAYTYEERTSEVPAASVRTFTSVDVDGVRHTIYRDPFWERQLTSALKASLRGELPRTLMGDEAITFLAFELPELATRWAIYGQNDLIAYKYLGEASPSVSFKSEIDWFDLDITFTVGDRNVPRAAVLASWREGKKYVRLKDGSLVMLPRKWLERHAEAAEELLEIRRVSENQLTGYAAQLAADLLGGEWEEQAGAWAEVAERLASFDGVASRPTPETIKATLRSYQERGYQWLAFLRDMNLGGCLADDMGLGKTLQALTVLADAEPGAGPSLVVAPTSVIWGWEGEAARFAPHLNVVIHHGNRRCKDLETFVEGVDVLITSYALLRYDKELLEQVEWRYVVLDEAQHIKNPMSKVAQAARALTARHRLALTGTPVENNLVELWSIFQFLMPGFFGSLKSFRQRYATPIQQHQNPETIASMRDRVRPFILRRLKREVATELPPRQEVVLYCELGRDERHFYQRVLDTYRDAVMDNVAERGVQGSTIHVLEALTRLRQACCHPALLPFDEARTLTGSSKITLLIETLETTIAEGHRTLIFSQWPSLLRRITPILEKRRWDYLYLDGSTKERQDLVARWNEEDGPPLFLISLKAGGTGLNLTGADHVIHIDPWWNPAVEDQATDRAHRIGQERPVTAYKLVARDTVEEKMIELQDRKRSLFDAAINEGRMTVHTLTREDLEAVFASR